MMPNLSAAEEARFEARLHQLPRSHRDKYRTAWPFPHAVVDDLLPRALVARAAQEIPQEPDARGCFPGLGCFLNNITEFRKAFLEDERQYGPNTKALLTVLKSKRFVRMLEKLTDVRGLIPDPTNSGSGLHLTGASGFLGVHADFNRLALRSGKCELFRRVNAFVYLNENWPEAYGGHLELWPRDMRKCAQRILPTLNRFVVFTSDDFSYHGHPTPMPLPPNRMRLSIAHYYYTRVGPSARQCEEEDCYAAHSTLWKKAPVGGQCQVSK